MKNVDSLLPTDAELKIFAKAERRIMPKASELEAFIGVANQANRFFRDKMINTGLLPTEREIRTHVVEQWPDWTGGDDRIVFTNIAKKITDLVTQRLNGIEYLVEEEIEINEEPVKVIIPNLSRLQRLKLWIDKLC